ncbi:MAG: 50S ribosomal protein L18 [Fidelibacterota bacterium]
MRKLTAKEKRFLKRRNRSKKANVARPERLRLVVFRSNSHIRAQIVDDFQGRTLVSASSLDKNLAAKIGKAGSKVEQSKVVGATIAERALKKKLKKVVFDRNGYPYHGRVKAVAEAAREAGLDF